MALANCSRCSKMFHKSSAGRVCSDCIQLEEEQFIKVRDLLDETPGCNVAEIEAVTGVEAAVILRFFREGRLATLGEGAAGVTAECKRCGVEIDHGRYCRACMQELGGSLKDSARALSDKPDYDPYRPLTRRPEQIRDRRDL